MALESAKGRSSVSVSDSFRDTIKSYLDKYAEDNPFFAEFYHERPDKSIIGCCEYIVNQAHEGGCAGYSDAEVYGWAVHYWEEADLEVKPMSGRAKVVVNHTVELTEAEKEELKRKVKEAYERECREKMSHNSVRQSAKTVTPKAKEEEAEPQLTLF